RHPPRLADRGLSPGQRNICKVSGALEVFVAGNKHFPAPNTSVGVVASAIQGETDHTTFEVVLRHTTCNVCVVVLDANQLRSTLLQRPLSGEVIGVEIVGDDLRFDFEDPLKMPDGFVEK